MKSPHPNPQRRISILAIILAVAGVVLLSAVALLSSLPNPLWLWCLLAVSFVSLEITAVEINDRLRISASTMAGFAAAVAFGRASAILAVVMMAALSAVHPDDIRERRWLQPAANFGQLVLSSAAGVAVFTVFLPHGPLGVGHLPLQWGRPSALCSMAG